MAKSVSFDGFRHSFEQVSLLTGDEFFGMLSLQLADLLKVSAVWVAEYHKEQNSLSTLVFVRNGSSVKNFTYLIEGTPCEEVMRARDFVHIPERIGDFFPHGHKILRDFNGESYAGLSLHDSNGEVIGSIAILHDRPFTPGDELSDLFRFIKSRTEAELQRLKRTKESLYRENQLRGVINGVQDLIISLNATGKIVMLNATAESVLAAEGRLSCHVSDFLADQSKARLLSLIEKVNAKSGYGYIWITDSLEIIPRNGATFRAEGTISRYQLDRKVYYTLVLRNTEGKGEPEEKKQQIIDQTEFMRDEVLEIKDSNQLVGESRAMKRLLQNVYMVAHTDATVLIQGDTGTGKELVARHIHQISSRKNKPMITVNCGAIPPALIESEFFGHAKGAFTGATAERKGRFQMADGGTIFLDEIGELPLELQVKLLRVIQESEFEPVGSGKTVKVDVRIIAATHRNLLELTKEGTFREDLYYRLNVFPVDVPPLRERGEDVILIANTFIQKFARRANKKISRLSDFQMLQLKNYGWPGNIRELQNIIERSVILAQNGSLDFSLTIGNQVQAVKPVLAYPEEDRILTKDEFLEFEKQNLLRALKAANWKVSGKDGAAALLRMVPSTLSSRIVALGIKVPKI